MKLSKKQSFNKSSSHRRLWLSSIITLFILATSISAYFLVKNSQDIRKSASDPYPGNCTCIYNSACSAVGMKPCTACSPACSPPAICCQPITSDLCTQGERYCVDANRIATCKPDRSGYTIRNCANGTSCNSQQNLCIADPTPNPAATCQQNGGSCMSVSCASVYMQSIAGSCSNPSYNCCKTIQQFACDAGEKECVNNTTRRYCNSERTAWITASCPSNSTCQNGTCVFPCQGTCYANSSCSAIGKYQAVGQCTNSSSVCCQDAPASCQGSCYAGSSCSALGKLAEAGNCPGTNTVCCKETSTPTCEGTCYTNTSCSAIGKVPAGGTCRYDTSICCKEASTALNSGLKAKGERCTNSEECVTGRCSNNYINNVGEVVWLGSNYSVCVPSLAEQDKSVVQQHKNELIYGAAGAAFAATTVAGMATIPSIVSLAGGSLSDLPTAAYIYANTTISTAPAWVQTGLRVAGVATAWAGVIAGQYACTTNHPTETTRAACDAYLAEMMGNPADMLSLATTTGGLLDDAGKAIDRYLHPPVIIPDSHSDLKSLKAYLQQQGVIDAYGNPTGKKAVFLGDYFGKSTNQLTGESLNNTPGIDVLNFVTDLQNKSPNSVTLLAGNWEPRYAVTMAAQDMDYTEQVDILVNGKGVSQFEIDELINDRALTREQFAKLNYITYLPDGSVAQHADTAELMRYALSENDLSTLLNSSDPALQQLGIDFINIQTQSNNLSVQNMKVIQEAIDQSNLSPNQIVNNINYNGQSIVDNALSIGQMNNPLPGSAEYSAQVFMYQDVANFHSQISSDLKFFEPGASDYVSQMASTLQTNTIVFGHTPNRDLVNITLDSNLTTSSNQSGLVGTFQNTGITIKDFDINLSRGMNIPLTNPNHPKGFWPRIDGVIQVPENLWLNISPIVN